MRRTSPCAPRPSAYRQGTRLRSGRIERATVSHDGPRPSTALAVALLPTPPATRRRSPSCWQRCHERWRQREAQTPCKMGLSRGLSLKFSSSRQLWSRRVSPGAASPSRSPQRISTRRWRTRNGSACPQSRRAERRLPRTAASSDSRAQGGCAGGKNMIQ